MIVRKLKFIFTVVAVSFSSALSAQYSLGIGPSTLLEFGNNKPFGGLHINFEAPRSNQVTFFGRATVMFNQKKETIFDATATAIDFANTTPQSVTVPLTSFTSMNYVILEGGTRYYWINGFDEGFSLYGGTNLAVMVNSAKAGARLGDYNTQLYFLDQNQYNLDRTKSAMIRLALGFTGGMKYTFPGIGSIYLDVNPYLSILPIPSNDKFPGQLYKNLLFNFNIGFRREIF